MMNNQKPKLYKPELVNQLSDECCNVIGECLVELGVDFSKSYKRLYGCCPIHEDSNNPAAFNLYPDGEEMRGYWVCRTRHCEKKWKANLTGLIHGVLSKKAGHDLKWTDAVDWMLKFLGYKSADEVKVPDAASLAKRAQSNASRRWNIVPKVVKTSWDRPRVRQKLEIPAQYFLTRGYKTETLDRYDVGFYAKEQRVLVPVYDPSYKFAVGFTGRSIYEKCASCGFWHGNNTCPSTVDEQCNASKWKNSKGFEAANHLYNYWFSRPHILNTSTIVVVEGPGDVWRMEEAGIQNTVALFGVDISEGQLSLLESSWAMNVVVMLDNDLAGRTGAANLKKKLSRTHRLYFPAYEGKDAGELNTDNITADIAPIINQIKQFNQTVGVK